MLKISFVILFLVCSVASIDDASSEEKTISLTANSFVNKEFVRIIFSIQNDGDINEISNFQTELSDKNLTITFPFSVTIDFSSTLIKLEDYLEKETYNDNHTIVSIGIKNPNIRIRKFIGETFFGIDLVKVDVIEKSTKEKSDIEITAQKIDKTDIKKEKPVVSIVPKHLKVEKSTDESVNESVNEINHTEKIPLLHTIKKEKITKKTQEKKKLSEETSSKEEKKIEKKVIKSTKNIIEIGREGIKNGIKLLFPFEIKTAAAIFSRGQNLWIVFDKPLKLNLDKITGIKFISSLKQIPHTSHTILLIKIADDYNTAIRSHKTENEWSLEIHKSIKKLKENQFLLNRINISSGHSINGPRIVLNAKNIGKPLEFIDTIVGDKIIFIPVFDEETGVSPARKYVDFELFKTAQGIVFRKISDSLKYRITNAKIDENGSVKGTGIEITRSGGLNISSELYRISQNTTEHQQPRQSKKIVMTSETIFPFNNEIEEDFTSAKNTLFEELTSLPLEKKSDKRMEIAKFFFSEGLYDESLGMINQIKTLDPLYPSMQEADITMAGIYYLTKHYQEAGDLLESLARELIEHESYEEITFWKWASDFQIEKNEKKKHMFDLPIDYIASYDKFMQRYPKKLRYEFGLLAVEGSIEKDDIKIAKTIMEIISYDDVPKDFENHTKFLQGRIAEIDGNKNEAQNIWEELSKDVDDRYNRARAIYEVTRLKLIYGEIEVKEAVKIFDNLSVVWRGDGFELNLLKLIGQLYIKEGEYRKGLKAWQILISNFPDTKEALYIAGKMKKVFIKLFNEGEAYTLPPLDALSLYFDFRDLTPVGEIGDSIIQNLVDLFIKADLLDNAASLLMHQVKFRVDGEKKVELAIKLAELQLKNKNPQKVFEALELAKDEKASDEMRLHEKYLKSKAYFALKENEKALELISDVSSEEADAIKLDIFWAQKEWKKIIDVIEPKINFIREKILTPLSESETKNLTRLSIAYGILEYREKLRALKRDFLSRINDKKAKNIFWFITNDIPEVNHLKFEKTVQLEEIETFMNEYAFWPGKDWKNVVNAMSSRVDILKADNLDDEKRMDIVRLALAYAMLSDDKSSDKKLRALATKFRDVVIDNKTIEAFKILDDKFITIQNGEKFNGKIPLNKISSFIEKYKVAKSISELNAATQ